MIMKPKGLKVAIFEGGGVLGASTPILARRLREETGIDVSDFDVFGGSSIGALNGLVLSLGLSIEELYTLWCKVQEKDVMPKNWFSPFRGKRTNKLDQYVETLLQDHGIDPNLTLHALQNQDPFKTFFSVATSLQTHKAVIFSPTSPFTYSIRVADAVKYSVSHPVVFDPNYIDLGTLGEHDLTDGGVISNCPVLALSDILKNETIDQVVCFTNRAYDKQKGRDKRYTSFTGVLSRVVSGLVERNEYTSYSLGFQLYGNRFGICDCQFSEDYDIFTTDNIPAIMREAEATYKYSTEFTPVHKWAINQYCYR